MVAVSIEAESMCDPEIAAAFQARLLAAGIKNYPRRLYEYALHIMNAGEPASEEIFKVFWLAKSLKRATKLGVNDSETCLKELAGAIRAHSAADERYDITIRDVFGERPDWLE